MSWRRNARIALAVIGLGTAVAIFVFTRRGQPPPKQPPPLATFDTQASAQGGPGTYDVLDKDGKPALHLAFSSQLIYEDGRMRFEKAELIGLGENKGKVHADLLEATGKIASGERPKDYLFKGHVVVETDDGLTVESEQAAYDDVTGLITIPGPLTFHRGRLTGRGVGGTYDRNQGTMVLNEQASAHVDPDKDGKGSADATAKKMSLARAQHSVILDGDARIIGQNETMTGQSATVAFTEDETAIKFVELRGGSQVVPSGTSTGERPEMNADDITMSMQPDGLTLQHARLTGRAMLKLHDGTLTRSIAGSWIDLVTAPDGQTLTRLEARDKVEVRLPATGDTPERVITSSLLNARGDDKKGLTSARFDGSPVFKETAQSKTKGGSPESKRAEALVLMLSLAGKLDAIDRADFDQNVKFTSGQATAYADFGRYEASKSLLSLRPNPKDPRKASNAVTPDITVYAAEIDLSLDSEDLKARRDVTTSSKKAPDGSRGKSTGALFDDKEPILGFADSLDYTKATGKAIYVGTSKSPAKIQQGKTVIKANTVTLTESTNGLDANGSVDSTLQVEVIGDKGAKESKDYNVHSDTMAYNDARRTAVYEGSAASLASLKMTDGGMEARVLTFELAAESRTLKRLLAKEDVHADLSGGYEVVGSDLTYLAETNIYVLRGKAGQPAQIKSPPDPNQPPSPGGQTCKRQSGEGFQLNKITGEVSGRGASQSMKEMLCSESLRKSK